MDVIKNPRCSQIMFSGAKTVSIDDYNPYPLRQNEVLIKTKYSGISAGSERLIYSGHISNEYKLDESIQSLNKETRYPCPYGYCSVGFICDVHNSDHREFIGKPAFTFSPHGDYTKSVFKDTTILPYDSDNLMKYIFLPNIETAISLVMDGSPIIGEKIAVVGVGVLGNLLTQILSSTLGLEIHLVENSKFRRDFFKHSSVRLHEDLSTLPSEIDLVYELTGNLRVLPNIYDFCRLDARIIIGSWYGDYNQISVLNTQYHRKRLKLISSQVSNMNPTFHHLSKKNRFHIAQNIIHKISLLPMITHKIPFKSAEKAYKILDSDPKDYLQICLTY